MDMRLATPHALSSNLPHMDLHMELHFRVS